MAKKNIFNKIVLLKFKTQTTTQEHVNYVTMFIINFKTPQTTLLIQNFNLSDHATKLNYIFSSFSSS